MSDIARGLTGTIILWVDPLRGLLQDAEKSEDLSEVRKLLTDARGYVDLIQAAAVDAQKKLDPSYFKDA